MPTHPPRERELPPDLEGKVEWRAALWIDAEPAI
jgi:hypothetical protein